MEAKATAKYVRMSPSKLKPVADLVRGKDLNEALTILKFTPGKGAELVEKVVQSAAANAENNFDLNTADLYVAEIYANQGPTMESAVEEIGLITGQRPVVTKARKSIANFKVRQGMPVGAKVTLRGDNMYVFADKFFNIALPRVRDFKGVSKNSFDGRGNYSVGIKEQLIFPEINYDKVDMIKGMNIVFTTTAKTDEEAAALLTALGMPFEK